jgi:hypothetical protein
MQKRLTLPFMQYAFLTKEMALKMEAVITSEMSVNFYEIMLCNIPEDGHFHLCLLFNGTSTLIASSYVIMKFRIVEFLDFMHRQVYF